MTTLDPLLSLRETQVSMAPRYSQGEAAFVLQDTDNLVPMQTEASGQPSRRESSDKQKLESTVLATMTGVVVGATHDKVLVKMREAELVVHFPRELFVDPEMMLYGTPLLYEVVRSSTGLRSQRFSLSQDVVNAETVQEVDRLLDGIKYR